MEEFARRGIEFAYPTTKQFTVDAGRGRRDRLKPLPLRNHGRLQTGTAPALRPTRPFA